MVGIWTIGHSTRKIEDFIAALEAHGIRLLVDVRSMPGSKRYPQFNKETLAKSLQEHGIHYEHFAELGGRRKPRSDSRNTAWRSPSFRGYADYMETEEFRRGVEAVWWRCHRALISDFLKARGTEVTHIVDAKKTETHPFTSAARIVGGTLSYTSDRDRLI
jgi:uncharacterized protein (DUF488 family)